jgi:hypothetical protein
VPRKLNSLPMRVYQQRYLGDLLQINTTFVTSAVERKDGARELSAFCLDLIFTYSIISFLFFGHTYCFYFAVTEIFENSFVVNDSYIVSKP